MLKVTLRQQPLDKQHVDGASRPHLASPHHTTEQTLAMNKKSIASHIANASALGGDIVVFPEGATGYFQVGLPRMSAHTFGHTDWLNCEPYWNKQANLNGTRSFMSKFCEVLPNVEHGLPVVIPCVDTR